MPPGKATNQWPPLYIKSVSTRDQSEGRGGRRGSGGRVFCFFLTTHPPSRMHPPSDLFFKYTCCQTVTKLFIQNVKLGSYQTAPDSKVPRSRWHGSSGRDSPTHPLKSLGVFCAIVSFTYWSFHLAFPSVFTDSLQKMKPPRGLITLIPITQ